MARVVCFGELLLRLGAPGREKLLQSPQLDARIGGAEANVGVSLAHFGHQVAAVSTVADNALGEAATGELRRHGLDTAGVRKVDVVCPGFAVDCLETLEEVALGLAEHFHAKGGRLAYIPCLNDAPAHAEALARLARCAAGREA